MGTVGTSLFIIVSLLILLLNTCKGFKRGGDHGVTCYMPTICFSGLKSGGVPMLPHAVNSGGDASPSSPTDRRACVGECMHAYVRADRRV